MPDMLVKLYQLPAVNPTIEELANQGVTVRRVLAPEKHRVVEWVRSTFSAGWASESEVAICNTPPTCFIAVSDGEIIGFSCYDATCKDFFGPTGVAPEARGRGIGKALLLIALDAMRVEGYAYAIIGGAGPTGFYARHAGATEIEGSSPGIYKGMLDLG